MLDLVVALLFTIFLIFFFLLVPSLIAYYLLGRRWMGEKVRIFFGTCMLINLFFVIFLVGIKLLQ